MLFHQSWWRCSILDSSVHPQMDRVHTPPSRVSTGTHSISFPLRTYNVGWFRMIYRWFLLLSPSLHQFIGAGKGGIPAAAKKTGRCSFSCIFIFLIWALENSKGLFLIYRLWIWAETGSCSFSSFRWINSVPASSSRYSEIHPFPFRDDILKGTAWWKRKTQPYADREVGAGHRTF